jgi:transcriptional regulator with XRE-family HTH domain
LPMCHERIRTGKPLSLPPGYPRDPKTLGERLRKRRLDLGLTQAELAKRIGCTERQIGIWERDQNQPRARQWPRIQDALGQDLVFPGSDFPSRLHAARLRAGLSQSELALRAGLDRRTIRNCERGVHPPHRRTLRKLATILDSAQRPVSCRRLGVVCRPAQGADDR